jgi:hypothetical protein
MQAGSRIPRRRGLVPRVGPLVALVGAVQNALNLVSEAGIVRVPRVCSNLARSKRRLALVVRRVAATRCLLDWVAAVHGASSPEASEGTCSALKRGTPRAYVMLGPRLPVASGGLVGTWYNEAGFIGGHDGLRAVTESELGQHSADVGLDRLFGDHESGGDL